MLLRQHGLSLDYNLIEHSFVFQKKMKTRKHRRIQTKGHPCQNSLPGDQAVHIGTWHRQFSSDQSTLFWLLCEWQLSHISGTIIYFFLSAHPGLQDNRDLEFPGLPYLPHSILNCQHACSHLTGSGSGVLDLVLPAWDCSARALHRAICTSREHFHLHNISISIFSRLLSCHAPET